MEVGCHQSEPHLVSRHFAPANNRDKGAVASLDARATGRGNSRRLDSQRPGPSRTNRKNEDHIEQAEVVVDTSLGYVVSDKKVGAAHKRCI